jgi:hypothetical protein
MNCRRTPTARAGRALTATARSSRDEVRRTQAVDGARLIPGGIEALAQCRWPSTAGCRASSWLRVVRERTGERRSSRTSRYRASAVDPARPPPGALERVLRAGQSLPASSPAGRQTRRTSAAAHFRWLRRCHQCHRRQRRQLPHVERACALLIRVGYAPIARSPAATRTASPSRDILGGAAMGVSTSCASPGWRAGGDHRRRCRCSTWTRCRC